MAPPCIVHWRMQAPSSCEPPSTSRTLPECLMRSKPHPSPECSNLKSWVVASVHRPLENAGRGAIFCTPRLGDVEDLARVFDAQQAPLRTREGRLRLYHSECIRTTIVTNSDSPKKLLPYEPSCMIYVTRRCCAIERGDSGAASLSGEWPALASATP